MYTFLYTYIEYVYTYSPLCVYTCIGEHALIITNLYNINE